MRWDGDRLRIETKSYPTPDTRGYTEHNEVWWLDEQGRLLITVVDRRSDSESATRTLTVPAAINSQPYGPWQSVLRSEPLQLEDAMKQLAILLCLLVPASACRPNGARLPTTPSVPSATVPSVPSVTVPAAITVGKHVTGTLEAHSTEILTR